MRADIKELGEWTQHTGDHPFIPAYPTDEADRRDLYEQMRCHIIELRVQVAWFRGTAKGLEATVDSYRRMADKHRLSRLLRMKQRGGRDGSDS